MEYHDWGYGSWGMDRIARWGMDRGMDRGVWIACGPGPLIHTLYFDLHPYIYGIYDIIHVSKSETPETAHGTDHYLFP